VTSLWKLWLECHSGGLGGVSWPLAGAACCPVGSGWQLGVLSTAQHNLGG